MPETKTIRQRWDEYQPTKKIWFWSCAGSAAATIIAGFWLGGWVTGKTATSMAEEASVASRAELAAAICVERFAAAPDFRVQLATLKNRSRWLRDNFLDEGGWTTVEGMQQPVRNAGTLCAEQLVAMKLPEAVKVDTGTLDKPETTEQ